MRSSILAAMACICLSACAKTYVTTDEAGRHVTGVPYYTARPYMLVSKTDERGRPLDAQLTYIPDRSSPQYVVQQPGLGSGGFTVSMLDSSNNYVGYLTKFDRPSSEIKVGEIVGGVANTAVTVVTGLIVADKIRKTK